jgi:predicted lipoprotein with Yx(FWY)xxD motif
MKRLLALLACLVLGAGLAGCGDDDDGGAVASEATTTTVADETTTTAATDDATTTTAAGDAAGAEPAVLLADTDIGSVLTDADGKTVYMFQPDTQDASACTEGCAQAWPPVIADSANPTCGPGLDEALMGTAARDDGSMQVTYNGHRLYTYSGDKAPGDTTGNGVGDKWFALTASGEPPA